MPANAAADADSEGVWAMKLKFWQRETEPARLRHYLYFPDRRQAEEVASRLEADGYNVEVDRAALGDSWLVLAKSDVPEAEPELDRQRAAFGAVAEESGGEYDGWEVGPLDPKRDGTLQGKVSVWLMTEAEKRSTG